MSILQTRQQRFREKQCLAQGPTVGEAVTPGQQTYQSSAPSMSLLMVSTLFRKPLRLDK